VRFTYSEIRSHLSYVGAFLAQFDGVKTVFTSFGSSNLQ
jgi:hypothetical protein